MTARGVEIRVLGELEVVHDGQVQPLPASKKTRALLAYLVATGRPHLRERLCALLWEGPDDPRAALRWSLSKIRPLLDAGGARLQADRERVAFVPSGAVVDAVSVRATLEGGVEAADLEALRAAAALFRGELLEGLDLPGCYRFHDWCLGEREAARALRARVLAALVGRLDDTPDQALRYARDWVAVDPLTEVAHVHVVRLLGRLGRVREAEEQAATCRRILETELGARPSQALEQARLELGRRTNNVAAGAPATTATAATADHASSHVAAPPPLIGRADLRQVVQGALADAAAGRATRALLFLGDPGIGKTRLLDLVEAEARAAGGAVLRGRAFEAEMVRPYGAWLDALRSAPGGAAVAPELAPLLPEAGGDAASEPGSRREADRDRLFDAVAQHLARLASTGVVAVVVDDVQWLDAASAALLHYVARAPLGGHVLLACAARSGELGDNAAALRVVRALDRQQRLVQHRLAPLTADETRALVAAVQPALDAGAVFASSEGNPLFALEIARAAGAGADALETSLDGLIDERLARLDQAARELLPWAAALGRSFAADVLADVTGIATSDLLHALEHLEQHGVVRPTGEVYDFAHDLLRQASYRRLSEPRRRLVHLQIARVLQRTRGSDEALAGEIAHHAAQGGDAALAAQACVTAGERCLRMFAYADAAALAARGLQHLSRIERLPRIRLHIALLAITVESGRAAPRNPDLDADLSRAIVDAQEAGLHDEAARGFHLRSVLHFTGEKFDAARESSLRALEEVGGADRATQARQLADSARCFMLLEREVPRARRLIHDARALLENGAEEPVNVTWASGLLARYCGDNAHAAPELARAAEGYDREQAHWERSQVMAQRIMLELESGRAAEARALCVPFRAMAAKMTGGSEGAVAAALGALADRALDAPTAGAALEAALAGLREVDAKAMLAYTLDTAAAQDLARGDVPAAEARAREALAAATLVERRSELAVAHALLGQAALARGDVAAAATHLEATRADRDRALTLSARAERQVDALSQLIIATRSRPDEEPTCRT